MNVVLLTLQAWNRGLWAWIIILIFAGHPIDRDGRQRGIGAHCEDGVKVELSRGIKG